MTRLLAAGNELDDRTRIIALFCVNSIRFGETSDDGVVAALAECVAYFRAKGDRLGEGLSLGHARDRPDVRIVPPTSMPPSEPSRRASSWSTGSDDPFGRTMVQDHVGSVRRWVADGWPTRSTSSTGASTIARGDDDRLGEAIALNHLGWARLLVDDPRGARAWFTEQLRIAVAFGHEEGIAFGLEGMSAVAAVAGDLDRAGMLFGATEAVRLRKGLTTGGTFSVHGRILERALANGGSATYEAARRAGRGADLDDMVVLALAGATPADAGHPHEPAGRL